MTHALIAFTLAAGLLTITPGLDTALVLRTAAVEGPRRAMLAGAGICLGCLTWGLATAIGLGALLSVSRFAYGALRLAGACYLIVLGARMLRRAPQRVALGADQPDRGGRWFSRGLLTNLLNPKVGVFYVTFLPQFVPADVSVTWFSMLLAGIHATEGILWFALLTLATRPLASWLDRPRVARTIDRTTGVMLVGFGVGLLLERRA
jgi:threonine/homoserine/homoserine lactone efflux protein